MDDLNELARSVVRIPVAGPAPNNTLVYVRAQFPPASDPTTDHVDHKDLFTVTLYRIEGFDQTRADEYLRNTKISVTGFLNFARSVGDQHFVFAIDDVRGTITADGHIAIIASTGSLAEDFEITYDFWLSAYILTQEPQHDFTRPPIHWPPMGDSVQLHSPYSRQAGLTRRPVGKDDIRIAPSPFLETPPKTQTPNKRTIC